MRPLARIKIRKSNEGKDDAVEAEGEISKMTQTRFVFHRQFFQMSQSGKPVVDHMFEMIQPVDYFSFLLSFVRWRGVWVGDEVPLL